MKISLITVTMGREAELNRLKASLATQTYRDFEHIVVDQREHPEFAGGLSKARNHGLSLVTGDVVAFADDDIWYSPDMLALVANELSALDVDGISFRVTDGNGNCSAGWMGTSRLRVSRRNVWNTVVSVSFFVKRTAIGTIRFDEALGVGAGTRFGSGEETDFALKLLSTGARIVYDGSRAVFHPAFGGRYTWRRGWTYGNGYGLVLRRHGYSPFRLVWAVSLQLVRVAQSLCLLRWTKCGFHLAMATGRLIGYLHA